MKPIYNKKVTPELIEKILEKVQIPEVKKIGENFYEFRCGNFVLQGNKQGMKNI